VWLKHEIYSHKPAINCLQSKVTINTNTSVFISQKVSYWGGGKFSKKNAKIVSTVTDSRDDQLMLEKTPFESHKMKHITTSKYRERAEEKRQERKEGKGMTEFHHYLFHNFTAADCG